MNSPSLNCDVIWHHAENFLSPSAKIHQTGNQQIHMNLKVDYSSKVCSVINYSQFCVYTVLNLMNYLSG